MPQTIEFVTGDRAGAKVDLTQETVRLGRHPTCEVVIDLNSVSRFHAHLIKEGDQYLIEDLKSRNGTFVNGKKIEGRVPLGHNDRVKICDTLLVYRLNAESVDSGSVEIPNVVGEETDVSSTVLKTLSAHRGSDLQIRVRPEAKLRAILDVTEAVGQSLEIDVVFSKILESVFKLFPQADRALIILAEEGGRLIPRSYKLRHESDDGIRFSRTVINQAMKQQEAILSADAVNDERFSLSQSIADFRVRSIMCAPLLTPSHKALGVLQVDTQSHQRFEEDDLSLLISVASQATIAIENARMHATILSQDRIRRELEFAREVQGGFLPQQTPSVEGYEFYFFYEAAGQVGGDFYDVVPLAKGKWAILLGDVSGKGVPAALMMAKATSDAKVALLTAPDDPSKAVELFNRSMCAAGRGDRFITFVLVVLDPATHQISIISAGHMSPIVRRAKERIVEEPIQHETTGLVLGIDELAEYKMVTTSLEPGDAVVLYSDGINEAMNAEESMYTIPRLREKVCGAELSAIELGECLVKDVTDYAAGHQQSDDMTLVCFSRRRS